MTDDSPKLPEPEAHERAEALAEDAKAENPDLDTSRETFELDLMEEGLSEEGASVELDEEKQ
jgi:hypothetical protein